MSEAKQRLIGDLICIILGGAIGGFFFFKGGAYPYWKDIGGFSFILILLIFIIGGSLFIGGIFFGGRFITKYVVALNLLGLLAIVIFSILFGWICCPIYLIGDIITYKHEENEAKEAEVKS